MPSSHRLATIAVIVVMLSACQARTQDPAQAGFFSGASNLMSGTYQQRVNQKQQELNATEQLRDQLQARATAAKQDQEQSDAELRLWQSRVTAMDTELARLKEEFAKATAQLGSANSRVARVDAEIRVLEEQRRRIATNSVPPPADQQRLEEKMQVVRDAVREMSRSE
jgi:archaellum component FlaC